MINIQTFSAHSHKVKAVIYGPSGSGKTHFASTAPSPIFASAESGLLSVAKTGRKIDFVNIASVKDLRELLLFLKTEKHNYKTVVIDSISEINEIIKEKLEKDSGRSMQLQDWSNLAKQIKGILRSFRDLDMHVIFIAQETFEKDDQAIYKVVPMLNGKAAIEIAYFMDVVGYSYIDKQGNHQILTHASDKHLTKDRSGLLKEAELNFSSWVELIASTSSTDSKPTEEPQQ